MSEKKMVYLPFAVSFFLFLLMLLILLPLVLSEAFRLLGFSPSVTIAFFFLSLFGSAINIPLHTVKTREPVLVTSTQSLFGFLYPEARKEYRIKETTIAINFGGALIPIGISTYLVATHLGLWLQFLLGIGVMTLVCYKLAKPIPGVGITMPTFVPPLLAALIAVLLPGKPSTVIAYVTGVIGVIIGADLLNINKTVKSGTKVLSIGGAGTFDGIFLTGIVSVVLVYLT